MNSVRLRPVGPEDEALLLALYSSTRAEEMAMTNWNEAQKQLFLKMQFAAQQQHYQNHYPDSQHQVILLNDEPVGRLWVARLADEIRILDITILPRHRNRRIGTPVIEELMREAGEGGKPLSIYVESYNPSVRLFERLGFTKASEYGHSHQMQWRPVA